MNDPEDYLNEPQAATRERGGSMSEMGPKLRATMERLHYDAFVRQAMDKEITTAIQRVEPIFAGILGIMGGKP